MEYNGCFCCCLLAVIAREEISSNELDIRFGRGAVDQLLQSVNVAGRPNETTKVSKTVSD